MVIRKALAVFVTLLFIVGSVFGLGLGEIDVKSDLNEPLEAEIELIQLQGMNSGEILPSLASNEDFRRAGIERDFFLSNIQFRVSENESGKWVVTLATRQAVREPFLNFLVEVNWPGGRLLKEYTVLLDPPVFDTGLAVDALNVTPTKTPVASSITTETVVSSDPKTTVIAVPNPVEPRDDTLPAGQYRVKRNDTLWNIAVKVPGASNYSPQQVMLAIQDLNPRAFLKSNINNVKAGSVLQLPSENQIAVRTLGEALSEVQAQNRGAAPKLRSPVANAEATDVQLSATESTSSALQGSESAKNPDGYLELAAETELEASETAAGESVLSVDQLQNQLVAAEELNDQYLLEREELESRVKELEEQIALMERLVDVQNSDLASVQQSLSQLDAEAAADSAEVMSDEALDGDAFVEEGAVNEESGAEETDALMASEPEVTDVVENTPGVISTADDVDVPVVSDAAPTPAAEPSQNSQGFMEKVGQYFSKISDWVASSVTNMIIAAAVLLLILVLPFYLRSKKNDDDEDLADDMVSEHVQPTLAPESVDEISDDLLAEVENEIEEEVETDSETIDAVVEAEMYMAYQKYEQAEEKLTEAFSQNPERTEIGIKLLNVYSETGNLQAFDELEARLILTVDQQREVDELRSKFPQGLADDLESDLLLDDLNLGLDSEDESESTDTESFGSVDLSDDLTSELEDDVDFNLDEIDLGESLDEDDASSELDFTLELDDLEEATSENSESEFDTTFDALLDDEEASDDDTALNLDMDLSDSLVDLGSELEDEPLSLDDEEPIQDDESAFTLETESVDLDESLTLDEETDLESTIEDELNEIELDEAIEDAGLGLDSESNSESDVQDASEESATSVSDEGVVIDFESDEDPTLANDELADDSELEDEEFDFLSGNDESSTKLDLARAYIEMEDSEGARDILQEVIDEGNDEQKATAKEMLDKL